jgi:putative heme-binding domain-containing protein
MRWLVFLLVVMCANLAHAQGGAAGPLVRLLESGRVAPERQGQIVEMICTRGEAADLAVVFQRLVKDDGFPPALRLRAAELLADAAVTRKVKPAGDLSAIAGLLSSQDKELQIAAIRLAAVWKLESVGEPLRTLAAYDKASEKLRQAAIDGLVSLGDSASKQALESLAASGQRTQVKLLAAAGLAKLDTATAARLGAAALAAANEKDDPTPLVDALLNRQEGAEQLAAELARQKLPPDVAKQALRHMYSVGRSDQALSDVLSKAAGIAANPPLPTAEEIAKISAEVTAQGNAERGERIFRRADLSCMKCHSIAQAGGGVGPELTAIGSISPVDYIVTSILNPNQAIKEQFITRKVLTVNGEVITGIQIDRDDQRLRLRDASGKIVVIPADDIDQEAEGQSLMPQGLTKFLTHEELLDLAKFVSELGRPGPYAIRQTPSIQRWRVLREPSPELLAEVPNVETVRIALLDSKPDAWKPTYGKANGFLPLAELATERPAVIYLQGELQVNEAGLIAAEITSTEKFDWWLAAEPFGGQQRIERELPVGRHAITLRVQVGEKSDPEIKVELIRPEGSTAQFVAVGGT